MADRDFNQIARRGASPEVAPGGRRPADQLVDLAEERRRRSARALAVADMLRELRASRATSAEAFAADVEQKVGRGELPAIIVDVAASTWQLYQRSRKDPHRPVTLLSAGIDGLSLEWIEAFIAGLRDSQRGIGYIKDVRPGDCSPERERAKSRPFAVAEGDAKIIERLHAGGLEVTELNLRMGRKLSSRFEQVEREYARRRRTSLRRIMACIKAELGGAAAALANVRRLIDAELRSA
jgi:hypothetical protein